MLEGKKSDQSIIKGGRWVEQDIAVDQMPQFSRSRSTTPVDVSYPGRNDATTNE